MVAALIAVALGVALVWGGASEFVDWLRARRRLVWVRGVFVGSVDAALKPGTVRRAGVFRFTTIEGQVLEGVSSLSTFPGPKPGKAVTVSYDPEHPEATAERAGVRTFKAVLMAPLLVVGGVALAGFALTGF